MTTATKDKAADEFTAKERKAIDRALLEVEMAGRQPVEYTKDFMCGEKERLTRQYGVSQK